MNNQAIIRRSDDGAGEMVKTLDDVLKLSDIVAKSAMFPDIQSQARAAMIIIAGQEIGVPPMASLRGLYVQKGKVEIHAGLLAAMIKSSGKYEYKVMERTDDLCRLAWFENGQHVGDSQYTIADAQRAQLVKPDSNWAKSPRAMCFARALTEGQRVYAPDIAIGAAYSQGEIPTDDAEPRAGLSDVYDQIGILLRSTQQDDNTAARRYMLDSIQNGAYQFVAQSLNVPVDVVLDMAKKIKGDLEAVHGQIEQDLNAAQAGVEELRQGSAADGLKEKIEETKRQRDYAPGGLRAVKPPTESDPPAVTTAAADPVAGIQVALSPTQQKVADAFMAIVKDHKKPRPDVLAVIGKFLGRQVTRAADLDDLESARVSKWLDAWIFKLKKNKNASPSWEFDQSYRNHDEANATRLDAVYQRLTSAKVAGQAILDKMQEILERLGAPLVDTRYALDDECSVAVCEIFEEWADDLAKEQSA